jgi:PAS domain S-box-containing protein
MLGYDSEEELKTLNIARDLYVNPDDRDKLLNELVEKSTDGDIELRLRRRDGTEIFVLEHSHPVYDHQGELIYFEGALTDITRRKAAETALRESETKYQTLLEMMQDGISLFDKMGKLLWFNQRKRLMLGYKSDGELFEKNAFDLIYPEDHSLARESWAKLIEKGSVSNVEMRVLRKDGSFFWAEFNTTAIKNEEGQPEFFMDTMRDVTGRKRDADLLRESAESYRTLFNSIASAMYILNRQGKFVNVNDGAVQMYGYERDFFVGKTPEFLSAPGRNDLTEVMRMIAEAFSGTPQRFEFWGMRKNGEVFPKEVSLFRTTYFGEEAIIAIGVDITERKRVAEELRIHSEHLQRIIDLVPSYIFAKDIDGRFLLTNKALASVFGMLPSETQGKTDADYGATPEQVESYRKADLKVIEKGIPVMIPEEQVLRDDGSLGWFQTVKIPYIHPGYEKPAILGVATDITLRKEAEDELRRSEERFRKLFESHSAIKLIINPADGSVIDANNAAAEFYGWPTERLRKMKIYEISTMSQKGVDQLMKNVVNQRSIRFESNHRLADGSIREVEVFSSRVEIDGKELLHSIIHDITDKKKILLDLIAAKEKAEESDRLKTAFLHNISHEIRTPMNAIVGFTGLLDSPDLSDEDRRYYIDMVSQSSNQLLSIISDIVEISNIETGQTRISVTETNVNRILVTAYDHFSHQAGQKKLRLSFNRNLSDHRAVIMTDGNKLLQVLSNLISNAIKFTSEGSVSFGYTLKGSDLEFFVTDTGIGITADQKAKVFDRFYQVEDPKNTKTSGTGLGLTIARAFVVLLGGTIRIDSTPGQGSTFYFTVPYSESSGHASSVDVKA